MVRSIEDDPLLLSPTHRFRPDFETASKKPRAALM